METGSSVGGSSETDPSNAKGAPLLGGPLLGGSFLAGDWPAQAADTIVTTVEKVRDRTTVPLMKLARATVYGVFIVTVAITVLTLAVIGLVRLLDIVLPSGVWLPYLVLGVATTFGGWLLYRRRNEPAREAPGKKSRR